MDPRLDCMTCISEEDLQEKGTKPTKTKPETHFEICFSEERLFRMRIHLHVVVAVECLEADGARELSRPDQNLGWRRDPVLPIGKPSSSTVESILIDSIHGSSESVVEPGCHDRPSHVSPSWTPHGAAGQTGIRRRRGPYVQRNRDILVGFFLVHRPGRTVSTGEENRSLKRRLLHVGS